MVAELYLNFDNWLRVGRKVAEFLLIEELILVVIKGG